ncbi:hypothetical protein C8J56DRAFT_968508 [Mycena floridula]|nr:hypothetical protein C8J56DRAFT_968508 [Mycena floridula]
MFLKRLAVPGLWGGISVCLLTNPALERGRPFWFQFSFNSSFFNQQGPLHPTEKSSWSGCAAIIEAECYRITANDQN